MADQTQFNGVGVGVNNVLSGIEGGFGFGFTLGTNLTIDALTIINTIVARNTAYQLDYTVGGVAKTVSIIHDPSTPFQDTFPENVPITFTLKNSTIYEDFTATITIKPNTTPVFRVRFNFKNAFARCTLRWFY